MKFKVEDNWGTIALIEVAYTIFCKHIRDRKPIHLPTICHKLPIPMLTITAKLHSSLPFLRRYSIKSTSGFIPASSNIPNTSSRAASRPS